MQELKKIGVLSMAKISMMFGLVLGLIFGIFLASITFVPDFEANYAATLVQQGYPVEQVQGLASQIVVIYRWFVLILPVIYSIVGFITGIISALLYNGLAKWVGGVTLDLRDAPAKKKKK